MFDIRGSNIPLKHSYSISNDYLTMDSSEITTVLLNINNPKKITGNITNIIINIQKK